MRQADTLQENVVGSGGYIRLERRGTGYRARRSAKWSVTERIRSIIVSSGPNGISEMDVARVAGLSRARIQSWWNSTGHRIVGIDRVPNPPIPGRRRSAGKIILTPDLAPGRRYDLTNAVVAAQSGRPIQTPCVARASRETSGRWIITPAEGGVDPLKEIVRNGSEASSAATAQPAATKPAASLLALPPQPSQSDSQAPDAGSTTPDPPKTLLRTATDMATIQGEQARRLSTLGDRIKRADQKAEAAYRDALPSATGKKPKFLGAGTGGPTTAAEGAAIGAAAGLLGGGLGGGATGMAIGGPLGLIGGGLGGAFYSHSKEEKKWREKQAAHASAVRHAQQLRSRIRKEELEKLDAQLDQEALTRQNLLRPTAATPSQPADPTPSQMPAAPWDN